MFENSQLQEHLETSSVIRLQSKVIAEWNMNVAENISKIGNYRFRPTAESTDKYRIVSQSFSYDDEESLFYTGATDADVIVDGGLDDQDVPIAFISSKEKEKMLYSLEDCFGRFRPRSGINKLRYFENKYSHHDTISLAQRPRYYMSDKKDPFKYWTSYRTENGIERGIANETLNGRYYIDDAAPYVVYKEEIPTNRIVLKVQTHVGDIDLGPFTNSGGTYDDPLFGDSNKTTPVRFKIQSLIGDNWDDVMSFDENSIRKNGSPVFGPDGYLEIGYGLLIPNQYYDIFNYDSEVSSTNLLPNANEVSNGLSFMVRSSADVRGTVYIAVDGEYQSFVASYGWQIIDEVNRSVSFVTDLTNPLKFKDSSTLGDVYREFQYIRGLRLVVETMNALGSTLDLIELSPRLTIDISEKVTKFSIKKPASDLGVSGLPVGQLLAATGSIDIFDYDQAFFKENTGSIINNYTSQNIQIKLYEIVTDVDGFDFFVPIKTMYSEGFPSVSNDDRLVSLNLRDLFFYFESSTAPQMLIQNASLSYAVSLLLDSLGFSNYVFKRNEGESEEIIPYFYIEPDKSVAQVLNDIARSTQSAMFFDEYNNFVVMSKGYMMPSLEDRKTDVILYGTKDFQKNGIEKNKKTKEKLSNIISISSQDNEVYNDGNITYSTRYIQKSYGSIRQASLLERDKTWIYKPALLWEVAATENVRSFNEEVGEQSAYSLAAMPLNSDLSADIPTVSSHTLQNNIIDIGDGIYWLTRYNGYLYANGEIIKYDAVEYSIPGLSAIETTESGTDNVWISSVREYQRYFSKVPFNGKIYPTGLIRIFSEPNYETVNGITRLSNGAVVKHGRGQFGTQIVNHSAGLSPYWTDDNNIRGVKMSSRYLFGNPESFKTVTGVSVESNDPVAVFSVPDASFINVGEYVERYLSEGELALAVILNTIPADTKITAVDVENNLITTDKPLAGFDPERDMWPLKIVSRPPSVEIGASGVDNNRAQETSRTGLIKNFFANQFIEESPIAPQYPATIQSSALVMSGNFSSSANAPIDFISYVYKPLEDRFKHFGTRLRIVGTVENSDIRSQNPDGESTYFTLSNTRIDQDVTVAGGSGGIAVLLNPETNNGYYFEIAALTAANISEYGEDNVANMFFYKVLKNSSSSDPSENAIPIKLWSGIGSILVDDGNFAGQSRMSTEENTTVYDLAVEYEEVGDSLRFYLYVNNVVVAIVDDPQPLPKYNNMGLFVRGSAKCMFENLYALTENYSQNTTFSLEAPANSVFGIDDLNANQSFQKYAVSGLIQSTYLSGISPNEPPKYNIFFEEFGTIMREAAYFKARYDKAYPALSAKISPTFNRIKGYTISGFRAGSYGAEFLVFNSTDSTLNLDSSSGNYLRIQGITFTQQSDDELTVDEYFDRVGNLSDPEISNDIIILPPEKAKQDYQNIKLSRLTQGRKSFSIDGPYIQSQDSANSLMRWLTEKIMKPRKSVGVNVFGMPTVQLGDIVQVDYVNENGVEEIAPESSRFVVYYIEYDRSENGPSSTLYLSEVV
jgi:hypothetical protein